MSMLLALALTLCQDQDLEARLASVLPSPEEERWLAVPWEPNLTAARAEAQRQSKPGFLWIMDGHVLGRT